MHLMNLHFLVFVVIVVCLLVFWVFETHRLSTWLRMTLNFQFFSFRHFLSALGLRVYTITLGYRMSEIKFWALCTWSKHSVNWTFYLNFNFLCCQDDIQFHGYIKIIRRWEVLTNMWPMPLVLPPGLWLYSETHIPLTHLVPHYFYSKGNWNLVTLKNLTVIISTCSWSLEESLLIAKFINSIILILW